MRYKKIKPYKYRNLADESVNFDYAGDILCADIQIFTGKLNIMLGFEWDGASGPAFDTKNSMKASMFHDAGCRLINKGLLGKSERKKVDRLYYDICLKEGMNPFRAWYQYQAIRFYQRNKKKFEKLEADYNKVYEV